MIRASNIESIERNLTRPASSATENSEGEPMEIGQIQPHNNSFYKRPQPATRPYIFGPNERISVANTLGRGYPTRCPRPFSALSKTAMESILVSV